MAFRIRLTVVAFVVGCAAPGLPSSHAQERVGGLSREQIEPPDVFVHVGLVRDELELIRFVMGRPKNIQPEIAVTGAEPREVYFQALSLFRKADRLSFEHTRERVSEPKLPPGRILPGDVYEVVNAALLQVRRVKQKLGISEQSSARPRNDSMQPNDVFQSCVQASRQLNLLLEQRFAPSDVFQQVTLGAGYASRLLEHFPESTPLPNKPEFKNGMRPPDVYLRLVGCFGRIRKIAGDSGLKVLDLEAEGSQKAAEDAEPSDVYDVASLLVSELAYLHSHLAAAKPPRPVFYVGRKFPSHVFQRAGLLEQQLTELETLVTGNPDWLGKTPGASE